MPQTEKARQKIIDYLQERGWSKATLASLIDVPESKLSQYLSGEDTGPKANETLMQIMTAFKIR